MSSAFLGLCPSGVHFGETHLQIELVYCHFIKVVEQHWRVLSRAFPTKSKYSALWDSHSHANALRRRIWDVETGPFSCVEEERIVEYFVLDDVDASQEKQILVVDWSHNCKFPLSRHTLFALQQSPRALGRTKLKEVVRRVWLLLASSEEIYLILENCTCMTVATFTVTFSFDDCPFHCGQVQTIHSL